MARAECTACSSVCTRHLAEVEAEAGLEKGARRRVERLTGCAKHIVHNGGHLAGSRFGRSCAFELKRFRLRVLVAAGAFEVDL